MTHECGGQTDSRTDKQTDNIIIAYTALRYLSRPITVLRDVFDGYKKAIHRRLNISCLVLINLRAGDVDAVKFCVFFLGVPLQRR